MSKEIELAERAAKGALHIFSGKIIARIIGMLGGIVLIRLLKPEEYGLIAIAGVAPNIFVLFNDGIDSAMMKYLPEYRSKNEIGNLKPIFYSGLIFKTALSCILMTLCLLSAGAFASMVLGKPHVIPLIQIGSPLILGWALNGLSEAVFIGLDCTKSYAAFDVIREILLSVMPIVLVLYGMGAPGALLGMVVATLMASAIGILASILLTNRMVNGSDAVLSFKSALKSVLAFGIPLAAATLISAGVGQYYRLMIAIHCTPRDIGNYNAAEKPLVLINYMAFPISTVLFPTFSKISYEKEPATLKRTLRYSVKYSGFLILPAAMVMMILARPLIIFLFGVEYEGSWIYLMLLAMGWLFYGLGVTHLRKVLLSQGETRFLAKMDALTGITGVITGLIFIPLYGVLGLIIISLASDWAPYIIVFKKAYKKYGVRPPLRDMGRLYLSTVVTGAVVALIALGPINELLKLVLGLLVGMITYITTSILINAINEDDIDNLREIVKPTPLINVIADKLFNIMEKIAGLRLHD